MGEGTPVVGTRDGGGGAPRGPHPRLSHCGGRGAEGGPHPRLSDRGVGEGQDGAFTPAFPVATGEELAGLLSLRYSSVAIDASQLRCDVSPMTSAMAPSG